MKNEIESLNSIAKPTPFEMNLLYMKTFVYLCTLLALYYYNFVVGNLWASFFFSWMKVVFSVSTMHDTGHGVGHPLFCTFVNWFCSCFGMAGTPRWIYKHRYHHSFTNSSQDPEVDTVKRPLVFWKLMGLYSLFHVDIALDHLQVQPRVVRGAPIPFTPMWKNAIWIGSFFVSHFVAPCYVHGLYGGLKLIGVGMILNIPASIFVAFLFQVAHMNELTERSYKSDVDFLHSDETKAFKENLNRAANFSTNNTLFTHLFGGLNFQIEHHMFPYLPHTSLPRISERVKEIVNTHRSTRSFPYGYNEFPSFWDAIESHIRFMDRS